MKSRLQYFLLQVNEYGSKQILDSGIYQHLDWYANKKDRAHGDVRVGDVILVYFTSNALLFKKNSQNDIQSNGNYKRSCKI